MAMGDIFRQGVNNNNPDPRRNNRNRPDRNSNPLSSMFNLDSSSIIDSIDNITDYSKETISDVSKYQISTMNKTYKTLTQQHKKYVNEIRNRELQLIRELNREWSKSSRYSKSNTSSVRYTVKNTTYSQPTQSNSNPFDNVEINPEINTTGLGKSITSAILSGFDKATDKIASYFTSGIDRFLSAYESSYSGIVKSLSWDHSRFDQFIDGADAMIKSNKLDNMITTRDIMDKMTEVSKSGLMGQQAMNKAMTDALVDTITDGFNKSTQEYTDLYALFGDDFTNTLAGATDIIKNTYGGRVVQAGFIDQYIQANNDRLASMTADQALQDIINATTQAAQLESQGVGTKAAMDAVIAATDSMNHQFETFQNGTAAEIMMAETAREGGSLEDVLRTYTNMAGNANTGNQLANSAYADAIFGMSGDDVYALANLANRGDTSQTTISNDQALSHYEQMLQSAAENNDKTTERQALQNSAENMAYAMADTLKDNPILYESLDIITSTLDQILAAIIANGIGGGLGNLFRGTGGKLTSGLKSLGSKISSGAKSAGAWLSSNAATIARVGGGIAGGGLALYDAYQGWNSSQDWLGSNSTGSKVVSGLAGALGGSTGKGLFDTEATIGDKITGIGGNAAKWALLGNAIVPGAGAVVGGIGGAVAGAIGSENIAQIGSQIGDVLTSDKTLGEYISDWINGDNDTKSAMSTASGSNSLMSKGIGMATNLAVDAAKSEATNDDILAALNTLISTEDSLLRKLISNTENPSVVTIGNNNLSNQYDSQFASYTSNYKEGELAW